jgi:Uma2 family endonuclease
MDLAAIPEWLAFPDVDKPYVEQIYERRESKVSPRRRHSLAQGRFWAILDRWAAGRGESGTEWRCYLVTAEKQASSLVPDVAYYSFERLPRDLDDDARERPRIAPDIAVEIISRSDRESSLAKKVELYLRHGSVVVIVVDPERRTLTLHRADGSLTIEARGKVSIDPCPDLVLDFDEIFRDF